MALPDSLASESAADGLGRHDPPRPINSGPSAVHAGSGSGRRASLLTAMRQLPWPPTRRWRGTAADWFQVHRDVDRSPARTLDDLLFIIRTTMPKGQAGHADRRRSTSPSWRTCSTATATRPGIVRFRPTTALSKRCDLTRPAGAAADKKAPAPITSPAPAERHRAQSGPTHQELLARRQQAATG